MASILIIEDDDDLRLAIKRMLQMFGYDVIEAPDGEKGIQLYQEIPTDLIITDIFMPEKDGLLTITNLKEKYPDIKIVALSGGGRNGALNYLKTAKKLGADLIFEKPVDIDVLLGAVNQLLETK